MEGLGIILVFTYLFIIFPLSIIYLINIEFDNGIIMTVLIFLLNIIFLYCVLNMVGYESYYNNYHNFDDKQIENELLQYCDNIGDYKIYKDNHEVISHWNSEFKTPISINCNNKLMK